MFISVTCIVSTSLHMTFITIYEIVTKYRHLMGSCMYSVWIFDRAGEVVVSGSCMLLVASSIFNCDLIGEVAILGSCGWNVESGLDMALDGDCYEVGEVSISKVVACSVIGREVA